MGNSTSLAEFKVMVVEDDFVLAMDTESSLCEAGAQVVGPFPSEELAIEALQTERPDAAVIDLNLGFGPTFVVAEELRRANVPFLILTGYTDAVPNELMHIQRMIKPVDMRRVVQRLREIIDLQS